MKEIYEQYLNNVKECHRLAKPKRFPATQSDNEVLEKIASNARRAYHLRLENDEILKQVVFSKKPECLTPEEVSELEEFADALLSFVRQSDAGIAYKIHCILYEYAKLVGDKDLYIKELYHLGISLYYLSPNANEFGINVSGKVCTAYLREGANYLGNIEEFESETTKTYIIRCIANLFLADENINGAHNPGHPANPVDGYMHFRKLFDEIHGVMVSPYYRKLLPNFDWDSTLYNLHFNRCLYYFNFQRGDLPGLLEDMLESAEYLYEHKKAKSEQSTIAARVDYMYVATKRRAGQAEVSDIVDVLLSYIEGADKEDYSADGVTRNLQLPMYLEYTYKLLPEEQKAKYAEKVNAAVEGIHSYLQNVPFNAFNNVVNDIVSHSVRYAVQNNEPVSRRLFNYLLCCHAPTYIHVLLTGALSKKIFERMVETNPAKAVGVFGTTSIDEVVSRKDELAKNVFECSISHDVGKVILLDYVEIYNRSLLDEEFKAITLHPLIGAMIVDKQGRDDAYYTALYHHCFNDNSGGYPRNLPPCPPEYKLMADIISVADSLEAATDNVGRCYATPKSFETIIEEFHRMCPSRYSPDVIKLFDDEEFFNRIKNELQAERRATYLNIYREKS